MRFGSVCSGIEAASVAWESLGWTAAWFAEVDAFPSAVLNHHWPHVPNMGDMTSLSGWVSAGLLEAPDILVGGTPCQAFSVAGARGSLDDDRGQLSLEFCRLADAIDGVRNEKSIIVWENVPGVLSTKDNAFGCFLGELSGAGGELLPAGSRWPNSGFIIGPKRQVAWRVLDAQFFGVAQRRRRVFVVASARDGFDPSEVLFEFESVRRDSPPSRNSGEDIARGTRLGFAESSFAQFRPTDGDCGTLKRSGGDLGGGSENLVVHGTQDPVTSENLAFSLGRNSGQENAVTVFGIQGSMVGCSENAGPQGAGFGEDISFTLTRGDRHCVAFDTVRRLMPVECERLQGFPDNHTRIPYRGKPAEDCPDGPRYAACGNSMAVPVMKWIGARIDDAVTMA